MGIGLAVAVGVSAVAGAKGRKDQEDANEKAQEDARVEAEKARQDEQEFLAEQARLEEEQKQASVKFGADFGEMGSYNDFISPKEPTKTASNTGLNTGLGFKV